MKKRFIKLFLLLCLLCVLSGCAAKETNLDFTNTVTESVQYELADDIAGNIDITMLELPCSENAYMNSWCAHNSYIFYAMDYVEFFCDHTGEGMQREKTEEYYSRIIRYDVTDGSTLELYRADGVIPIYNVLYNGQFLIWQECPGTEETVWQIKGMDLSAEQRQTKVLLSSSDVEGTMWKTRPQLTEEALYVYELLEGYEELENPVLLYRYDLKTGDLKQICSGLDLASPYEEVPYNDGWMTTYQFGAEHNSIFVENEHSGKKYTLQVSEGVADPFANEDFCIWRETYDAIQKPHLMVYHAKEKILENVSIPEHIFAYALMDKYVFMTTDYGLWLLDLQDRKMQCLEDNKNYSYTSIRMHSDGCIYTEFENLDNGGKRIAKIEVGATQDTVVQETASEPTVITLGTLEENYDLNDMASGFNKAHPEYRIEVKVYGSGMHGDTDGLNDLRMEIVSGAGPDIINFGSNYSGSFAAGGITKDLFPYLQKEGMLKDETYFSNLFCATQVGEELKAVFPSFSLVSFVGKESLLGGRNNWDIKEMKACYSAMPDGTLLFPGDNKISVFAFLCMETMDSFVDWNEGTCHFTDERFVDMLTFTDFFPEELRIDENFSYHTSYAKNQALLFPITVEDVYATGLADALMGEKAVFIGYPIDKAAGKKSGNLIKPGEIVLGIGANSKHEEGAWDYIKMFLEEDYQRSLEEGLPVKRSVLEECLSQAQVPELIQAEDGNSIEAVQAEIGLEGEDPIQVTAITEEQARRLIQIIENADSSSTADKEMYYIAREEAQMYLSKDRSAEETAKVIQSRLSMYVGEKQ